MLGRLVATDDAFTVLRWIASLFCRFGGNALSRKPSCVRWRTAAGGLQQFSVLSYRIYRQEWVKVTGQLTLPKCSLVLLSGRRGVGKLVKRSFSKSCLDVILQVVMAESVIEVGVVGRVAGSQCQR
jgi:hypothetical protein